MPLLLKKLLPGMRARIDRNACAYFEIHIPEPGFVPLPGMVGYVASVWDPLPTYIEVLFLKVTVF